MAIPSSFDKSNDVLGAPPGMEESVDALSIFRGIYSNGVPFTMSCWKLTEEELNEIVRTKRVWVSMFGVTHPPLHVSGVDPLEGVNIQEEA